MDRDDDRDESIVEARITGTSSRALAKLHRCTSCEVEEAIDWRLDYEVDNRMRLRAVKLSAARLDALRVPFFEKAMKGDAQAGLLCVKIEERRALLFGLDQPLQSRVDVYQIQAAEQPTQHEQIRRAIYAIARGDPDYQPDDDGNGNGSSGPSEPSH
jgi:hypothetical protein